MLIIAFLYAAADALNSAFSYLFYYIAEYPRIELLLVMICIPFILNILAFWVTDSFLKKSDFESISQFESIESREGVEPVVSASFLRLASLE